VGIDGEIAVGSGHKIALSRDPPNFLRKPLLPVSPAYVFDDSIGEHPIERTVWKRQRAAVRYFALNVLQPFLFEEFARSRTRASNWPSAAAAGAARKASARNVPATSIANCFPGSWGSIPRQACWTKIQAHVARNAKTAPATVSSPRGGNDFFVGTTAASKTFTLGTSLASCTLASSYCCVSSS